MAVVGLFILATIYTLHFGRPLFIPLTAAALLSFLLSPVVRMLRRAGVPTMLGTIMVFVLFIGSVGSGIYLLSDPAAEWAGKLPENVAQAERELRSIMQSVGAVREAVDDVASVSERAGRSGEPEVVTLAPTPLSARILAGAQAFVIGAGASAFVLFFLLSSGEAFLRRTVSMLPTLDQKKRLVRITRGIEQDLSAYLLTTSMINVGLGIAVGLVLFALGVPNPVLFGVIVALLNFVPYIGAIVGVLLIGLVAIVSLESTTRALLAPAAYIVFNVIEAYVITPHVLGRRFSLNPVVVFGAVAFWGWIWGIPGALLAVPILTAATITCANIDRLRPIAVFLGADSAFRSGTTPGQVAPPRRVRPPA
jgi:predicted PurR-regulated permease PerM